MADQPPFAPLLVVIRDLLSWLDSVQLPSVIVGGVAASLLGRPRFTHDVDVVVLLEERRWKHFLNAGVSFGFAPRREDVLEFAGKSRVLLMRHNSSGINVDISFAALPFEMEMLQRKQTVEISALKIPVPSPEDLMIMKAVAHRPQDLADMEAIVDARSHLDRKRILKWVREFARVLDMPEIHEHTQSILRKPRKRRRHKR